MFRETERRQQALTDQVNILQLMKHIRSTSMERKIHRDRSDGWNKNEASPRILTRWMHFDRVQFPVRPPTDIQLPFKPDAGSPMRPFFCRIADYSIDKVHDDPGVYSQALEPRGDFKRVIVFSVKLVQVPSDWMGVAGQLDQENWLHISHIVAITKTSEGYMLEFANP